jgi:hypothetical protein
MHGPCQAAKISEIQFVSSNYEERWERQKIKSGTNYSISGFHRITRWHEHAGNPAVFTSPKSACTIHGRPSIDLDFWATLSERATFLLQLASRL